MNYDDNDSYNDFNGVDGMTNADMVIENVDGVKFTGGYKLKNLFKESDIGPYMKVQQGGFNNVLTSPIFKEYLSLYLAF